MFLGKKELIRACAELRSELDDHLDAINSNSGDVSEVRESIGLLDEKIEKLASRIDELYLLLGAEHRLTEHDLSLQQFLQVPRTIEEVCGHFKQTPAAAERMVRTLFLKGVEVHTVEYAGLLRFTTNRASSEHVSLSHYFAPSD